MPPGESAASGDAGAESIKDAEWCFTACVVDCANAGTDARAVLTVSTVTPTMIRERMVG
jgi:hypothetical protein